MERIYLDHAATTPLANEVLEAMLQTNQDIMGNPSSTHFYGRKARSILDQTRAKVANHIQAHEKEIIFTSGGTEADNLAIIGSARANSQKGRHIITTAGEHHAVLHTMEYLETEGFDITYLSPNNEGYITPDQVKEALREDTILVSMMYVNNETGMIQDIQAIAALLKEHQAYFHTDAVQAFGIKKIDVDELGIDLLSMSAHKINGPQGVGFLYCKQNVPLENVQHGGEQERKKRAGTENLLGIVGLEKAIELAYETMDTKSKNLLNLKQTLLKTSKDSHIDFEVNGTIESTVPSIVNVSFPNTQVEQLLMNFDLEGVAVSSGSACTAGTQEPSHVLVAMYGKDDARIYNSIRFSFGAFTTEEEVIEAGKRIAKIVKRLQK